MMIFLSLLLLGGTRAFAGGGNDQGNDDNKGKKDKDKGDNGQGDDGQGQNDQWQYDQGSGGDDCTTCGSSPWANDGGGGTAPIDGGISLLLVAGVGLGVMKLAKRPSA